MKRKLSAQVAIMILLFGFGMSDLYCECSVLGAHKKGKRYLVVHAHQYSCSQCAMEVEWKHRTVSGGNGSEDTVRNGTVSCSFMCMSTWDLYLVSALVFAWFVRRVITPRRQKNERKVIRKRFSTACPFLDLPKDFQQGMLLMQRGDPVGVKVLFLQYIS